jgi:hypothetical protein
MGLLRLSGFSGMWPIRDPRALPDNAAVLARNTMFEGGAYLKGARLPSPVKLLLSTTRMVFRIPLPGANTLINSYWMEFTDENTSVFRGSLVNDSYERFYWATGGILRYALSPLLSGHLRFQAIRWGFIRPLLRRGYRRSRAVPVPL